MKSPEQVRIEAKLNLWETPGFFQFLEELEFEMPGNKFGPTMLQIVDSMKKGYQEKLKELEPKSKFKQGKLPL